VASTETPLTEANESTEKPTVTVLQPLPDESPRPSKLMSAHDAVERFVSDGDSVFLGYTSWAGALEREIARQRKRNLTTIATVGSLLLPLAGCASRQVTSYALGAGSPWFMERYERGEFQIEDYSNQSVAMMFMAGALGIPFIPTRAFLGSDYLNDDFLPQPGGFLGEDKMRIMESPFDGTPVVALPAMRPDVSCVHVQWADEDGNAACWGGEGEVRWGLWASKKIVISAEEIVPRGVLRSDPHRTTVPGLMVDAVVHLPFGASPWGVPGYYAPDAPMQAEYLLKMRTEAEFLEVMERWVDGCADHGAYLKRHAEIFGQRALDELRVDRTWEPERPIRYGWKAQQ
jgi:glutaconate CoA-transferase subunit A